MTTDHGPSGTAINATANENRYGKEVGQIQGKTRERHELDEPHEPHDQRQHRPQRVGDSPKIDQKEKEDSY